MEKLRVLLCALLLIIVGYVPLSASSRILAVLPMASKSQIMMHKFLMNNLASRGHRVTVLTFFDESDASSSNYTHISLGDLDDVASWVDNVALDDAKHYVGLNFFLQFTWTSEEDWKMCRIIYSNEYISNLLNGKIQPPDLLITEFFQVPCLCSLAEKFDVPVIFSAASLLPVADYVVGNPLHPSYWPSVTTSYTQTMNFQQRLINWFHHTLIYSVHHFKTANIVTEIDKTYVGNKDVSAEKLYGRINLVLSNNHFSFLNRPTVPNSVEIGGLHIQNAKPLPAEIRQFIEESKDGVIYFSFGTCLKFSSIPKEKIEILKKAFSQIPQRVLWRSDVDNLTDLPSNIMMRKWFPQRDILAHNNVKVFISHCGIFSSYEAIYTGTPIIGIPFFYDQIVNFNVLREKGVAIGLDYDTLNYEGLLEALKDIINDRRYYKNMRKLSIVFKDRPMSPLDTAIYWIEYVIRHKGAPHLRSVAADMPMYKFLLLDVIGFLLICLLTVVWTIYYLVKKLKIQLQSPTEVDKKTQ